MPDIPCRLPSRAVMTVAATFAVLFVFAGVATAGLVSSLGVARRTVTGRSRSIVVDRQGAAVYELSGESLAHLECVTADCLKVWSPLSVRSPAFKVPTAPGVPGPVSTFHRVKGNLYQVMLDHHPIYVYTGDTVGMAKGQGIKSFGGTWHVVNAR